MLLSRTVEAAFPRVIRSRGEVYFQQGAVRSILGSAWACRATVDGTRPYTVFARREGRSLAVWCDCPYFGSDGPCKHLWAAFLLADEKGFLAGHGEPVTSVCQADLWGEDSEEEEIEDEDPEDEDAEDEMDDPEAAAGAPTSLVPRFAARGPASRPPLPVPARPAPVPDWRRALDAIVHREPAPFSAGGWPVGREVLYVVDVGSTLARGLTLEILGRDHGARGPLKPKPLSLTRREIGLVPDRTDRRILSLLAGAGSPGHYGPDDDWQRLVSPVVIPGELGAVVLPEICATGRSFVLEVALAAAPVPLALDDGAPWQLVISCAEEEGSLVVRGSLARGEERCALGEPSFLLPSGLFVMAGRVSRYEGGASFPWVAVLRRDGALEVPASEADRLFAAMEQLSASCRIELPDGMVVEEGGQAPIPVLRLSGPGGRSAPGSLVLAGLGFEYGGHEVPHDRPGDFLRAGPGRLVRRDRAGEAPALGFLARLGFRRGFVLGRDRPDFMVEATRIPAAVRELVGAGWKVEAEGKLVRSSGAPRVEVTSGVDWFDLRGAVDFGGLSASLPELLAALRRREGWVLLGDGSYGLLPEEWLRQRQLLASVGEAKGDRIRFGRGQAALLDALLESEPEAKCDAPFTKVRKALSRFKGVVPRDPPRSFVGSLRPYQREGLGWLTALADLGFGGCLADDMGLGKTVQVLALLEKRRRGRAGPSLVVVPRSLVFNWMEEAARFTPRLRLLDHTGAGRDVAAAAEHDVVVTTYGTLKRDIEELRKVEWDYVVLDEAQAVKNAATATARAVRLLSARHRLAMSGTPIENHLGELWSLLDFLNPGVMGKAGAVTAKAARDPDGGTRELLARAVRPFILRRTKEKVAPDLPRKSEQTIVCEMAPPQRRLYTEVRDHYRRTLLPKVDRLGMARSKIHVLEALLRLRQVACHPGLLDDSRRQDPSAKLEALLPQLEELREEGHKALVFSQFTSFLALVRSRLDASKVPYEYLDGQTTDRAARVQRFQSDPVCPLFLVSLKAGGLGLNLTAAGYVFILDPWWNPAVEAQAIDRTHRIGQTRPVFAYRLITKGTIEEKVAELQKTKKQLAESILSEDAGILQTLRREDLELLLS